VAFPVCHVVRFSCACRVSKFSTWRYSAPELWLEKSPRDSCPEKIAGGMRVTEKEQTVVELLVSAISKAVDSI
jgi:hypothetical protein